MIALPVAVVGLWVLANARELDDDTPPRPPGALVRWALRKLAIRSPSGRY